MNVDVIKELIRNIPDYPKKGIIFKDITPLLSSAHAFESVIDLMSMPFKDKHITKIVGIESRGFIFGAAMARKLGAGFVPARKKGKLPFDTISENYDLEYGTDTLQVHCDALVPGESVLIVDDVLATGGTAKAVKSLVERLGANLVGFAFLMELAFLNGSVKLGNTPVHSLLKY